MTVVMSGATRRWSPVGNLRLNERRDTKHRREDDLLPSGVHQRIAINTLIPANRLRIARFAKLTLEKDVCDKCNIYSRKKL